MGEIQLTRIKSYYGELKGLLDQIPPIKVRGFVSRFIVDNINKSISDLSNISNTDYSRFSIPLSEINHDWNEYPTELVTAQLGRVIKRLELEYDFGHKTSDTNPGIVIFNNNENDVSLKINYTISSLIETIPEAEGKLKLLELEKELKKPEIEWNKVKDVLIWILNFSKDLFLKIIPIILQSKL